MPLRWPSRELASEMMVMLNAGLLVQPPECCMKTLDWWREVRSNCFVVAFLNPWPPITVLIGVLVVLVCPGIFNTQLSCTFQGIQVAYV